MSNNNDERDNPISAANAKSAEDARSSTGTCPLMKAKLQLLPLRYGVVEELDPSGEITMPFSLQSRPLGLRRVRDGYLYIIDATKNILHEYQLTNGNIEKLLWQDKEVGQNSRTSTAGEPHLIFPRCSLLYVAYSEIQWTARKCSQVLESSKERDYFMQKVNLAAANAATGGKHLITLAQAEKWLAEVAENAQPATPEGANPEESQPYIWEQPDKGQPVPTSTPYKQIGFGALTKAVLKEYQNDCFCLVLQDDIGVMRDLAQFQDKVVGWISDWAEGGEQPGNNERDYMLGCYIESLTQITADELTHLDDKQAQAMLDDLGKLPEQAQSDTRKVIIDYLNNGSGISERDPTLPRVVREKIDAINRKLAGIRSLDGVRKIKAEVQEEIDHYYLSQRLSAANAGSDFVSEHIGTIIRLKKEHNRKVKNILNGASLGQRGIDDLIDRPAMDQFLAAQRRHVERWNVLLSKITADRNSMFTESRFHRAAWYYDLQQAEQLGLAFATQYACLKDICRSDEAIENILKWLEKNPEYDRPLFHTLPLNVQQELKAQYAQMNAAGYTLASNFKSLMQKLKSIEEGKLPAIDELPETTQALAKSAQSTLDPALSHGISRLMDDFFKGLDQQKMPDLDQLFRTLPKALSARLLQAGMEEGFSFSVASEAEIRLLQQDIQAITKTRTSLAEAVKQRAISNSQSGHKSEKSRELLARIKQLKTELDMLEPRLAASLSPIGALPEDSIRVSGAAMGKAGITLILPPEAKQEIGGMLQNARNGYANVGKVSKLGDGLGLAVAVAQVINFITLLIEYDRAKPDDKDLYRVAAAALSTGAAGISVAQSIAGAALQVRATQFAAALQQQALTTVRVHMGRLHFILGGLNYLVGGIASLISSVGHYEKWTDAVRSGNVQAQQGAAMALTGSSLMTVNNIYGFTNTLHAGLAMRKMARKETWRAAWSVAGPRLASVFFRFNIAGALFTMLELAGTWLYNRNNISAHDEWLLSTPWSQDAEKRQNHSLAYYQQSLQDIFNKPLIRVTHQRHDNWFKDWWSGPVSTDINLEIPNLSAGLLNNPVSGRPGAHLFMRAYTIRRAYYDKGAPIENWSPATEKIEAGMELVNAGPLILKIKPPAGRHTISYSMKEEILVELNVATLDEQGKYQVQHHTILSPVSEEGVYKPAIQSAKGSPAHWTRLNLQLIPELSHDES
ncbi:toxin VasX [Oceanimonas smirnovii]|uniref:toxin VasX n=1 Tax=Oceanimonas smirnovii TaxID=264574 RepID=UPI00037A9EB2|nr:toxin VasX [Oceanimonas smirnovii]